MVFPIRILNKSKVLIPCENSTNATSMVPILFISHSKVLGCGAASMQK
jgi:hypothetical protein